MKLLILSLLVLTSLCFVLGDEEDIQPNFADSPANDGEMLDDAPEDYVEDEEDNYMEDDEDYVPEEQDDDEPKDPDGFKDDDLNQTTDKKEPGKRPLVDPIVEVKPPKGEEEASGLEPPPDSNQSDEPDLKEALKDKLRLNPEDDDLEFTKK
ncbi:uncharacterized protein LOC144663789 isoform X1 [Oculina patagonica]